jgi:hypothetical protein
MKSKWSSFYLRTLAIASPFLAILVAFTWLGLSSGVVMAQDKAVEKDYEDFDYDNFDNPTNIDNEWLPLKPGTQWVHEGSTNEDGEEIPHRIEFTVTDLTKVIDGVRTVVVWILDYSEGELVEKEICFYAQANDGTVWYLGEHPEAYEDGKLVEAATWIAGVQDAKAGIFMPAEPRLGTPSFSQGWAPAVDWTDRAQVYKMGQKTTVPAGSYEDVLVMDEFDRKEPDKKLKYYARGVGNVRVGWRGEPVEQETMELVKRVQLGPEALAEVRTEALELEKRAYEISKDVFGRTPPAEHTLSASKTK